MSFKKDFIWGTSTASYQIEGGAFEDGKGLSVWDRFSHTKGKVFEDHNGDVACDHYHRYEEDLNIMQRLGIKNYRFSISWPRLLPCGTGKVNQKGLDFYNRLIDGLLERNIRPFVTLFHWDYPLELLKKGGWENGDSPKWFEEYAVLCAKEYGDRVKDFIPLNEPPCFVGMGHVSGEHAPGLKLPLSASIVIGHNALKSNGLAIRAIRSIVKDVHIGYAPNFNPMMPASDSREDIEAAKKAYFYVPEDPERWYWNSSWWSDPVVLGSYPEQGLKVYGRYLPDNWQDDMPIINQRLDFYGQNIYQGHYVKHAENEKGFEIIKHKPGIAKTASEWPVTPDCLYWGAKYLYERYRLPLIITENGMADLDAVSLDGKVHDPSRKNYLRRYLISLKKAADEGVDVAGYFYWSFLDNFEWARGYSDRFGIVYVDYDTLERIPKDSAYWYKNVIETNGECL